MKREVFIVITIILLSVMVMGGFFGKDYFNRLNTEIDKYKTEAENYKSEIDNTPEYDFTSDNNTYTCEYIRTYSFLGYYNYEGTVPEEYYIILSQFQSSNPIIEKLNSNTFSKDFKKGQNYEITYKTTINYLRGFLDENTEIIKIESTDKTGLDQTSKPCILRKN